MLDKLKCRRADGWVVVVVARVWPSGAMVELSGSSCGDGRGAGAAGDLAMCEQG